MSVGVTSRLYRLSTTSDRYAKLEGIGKTGACNEGTLVIPTALTFPQSNRNHFDGRRLHWARGLVEILTGRRKKFQHLDSRLGRWEQLTGQA